MDYTEKIRKCPLFDGIGDEELNKILQCLSYRITEYKRNDYAVLSDEKLDGVGIVLDGEIAVVKESLNGNSTRVDIFREGEMFGEIIAQCRDDRWPASVQAVTNCMILYIHPEKILNFCDSVCAHHRILLANLVRLISQKAYNLSKKVEYLSLKSIAGKLSKYLMEQYIHSGNATFTLPLNREELAEFLNVSRPSMSRELCRMRDEGILEFYRESVRLIDPGRLKVMLEQ